MADGPFRLSAERPAVLLGLLAAYEAIVGHSRILLFSVEWHQRNCGDYTPMANDLLPQEPVVGPGVLEKVKEVLGKINLPKMIAGPAGEAISRLIAGGADIPAAWLEQKAKAIRDKTDGQSLVAKTLAGAAAELVKNDPALVQRAADAFIAKEIRHQHNRESIAIKAVEHLKETPEAETTRADDDWLNMYARHAQEASSDRLQDIWARILAGQLRKPLSFSLQTLRFVSELDEHIVGLFEKWSIYVIDRDLIPFPPKQGEGFIELLELEDFGLVAGVASNLTKTLSDIPTADPNQTVYHLPFHLKRHNVLVRIGRPISVTIPNVLLTRIGREIYSITKTEGSMDVVRAFADQFPKHNVEEIICFSKPPAQDEHAVTLWSKPTAQPPSN
jgi:hypothetical protein